MFEKNKNFGMENEAGNKIGIVWTVETIYTNGSHELNSICSSEDKAKELAEFIKSHDGVNGLYVQDIKITDWIVF